MGRGGRRCCGWERPAPPCSAAASRGSARPSQPPNPPTPAARSGLGLILLNYAHSKGIDTKYRKLLLGVSGSMVVMAYLGTMMFLRIKMPSYLLSSHDD